MQNDEADDRGFFFPLFNSQLLILHELNETIKGFNRGMSLDETAKKKKEKMMFV